jgi:hypothetical protein
MKLIYQFTLNKEQEVEKEEKSKNEAGEEVTVKKKVKEQVPHKFAIRTLNRGLKDEASIFYAVNLAENMRVGMMTHAQLRRRLIDDGGILSEQDKVDYVLWNTQLFEKQSEYQKSTLNNNPTDEDKKKTEDILKEIIELREKIREFEFSQSTLFEDTAEIHTKNKLMMWFMLMLSYKYDRDKLVPVFGEGSFEDRLKEYDKLEENEDEFNGLLIRKLLFVISAWQSGIIDANKLDKILQNIDKEDEKKESKTE